MACKVLIVDDQIVPRQLFENIIASSDRYEIAASLDSASLSLAQTPQRVIDESGNVNPLLRVFWCVILTLIPLSIMFVKAEFNILKILSVIISIPFMLILIYMFIRFMSWIREDAKAGKLEEYGGPKE